MILDRPFKAGAPGPNIPARRVATVDPTFHSIVALRRARIMARGAGLKRPASGDWTFFEKSGGRMPPVPLRARYGRKKLAGDLERVLGPEGERPSGKGLVSHPVF